MLVLEWQRPLRREVESKPRRVMRNLTTGGIAFGVVTFVQTPFLVAASRLVTEGHFGLLNFLGLAGWAKTVFGVVLLDYTLWHWHRINHKVPFFWRFHLVHHVDLDLDASTALRFHFGEFMLSVGYRILQVVVIGADMLSVTVWQALLIGSILFHHSNTRLPAKVERFLVRLIVTPRMHGIHHSTRVNETNSNWSSLLSVWDYLHHTVVLNVPQQEVVIGVPSYQEKESVTLGKILALPFRKQREDWQGANGKLVERSHDPDKATFLRA